MSPSIRRLLVLTLVSFVALSIAGCAKKSLAPTAPRTATLEQSGTLLATGMDRLRPAQGGWASYFPLDSGSIWTYSLELRLTLIPNADPTDVTVTDYRATLESRMLGQQLWDDVAYTLEQDTESGDQGTYETYIFLRQDAQGLHEAVRNGSGGAQKDGIRKPSAFAGRMNLPFDRAASPSAQRAWERARSATAAKLAAIERTLPWRGAALPALSDSGQVPPGPGMPPGDDDPPPPPPPGGPPGWYELLRLSYPLHSGQHWKVDPGLSLLATVEGTDVIRVGSDHLPCWRIGYVWPDFFGPNDRVQVWYGRDGYLGLRYHLESPATDGSGNVIGVEIAEETRRLTSLSLAGAHRGLAFDPER